ncbi:MAG: TolC family protein [Chlamydiae bacterium]|nr:TolC family protein [Chlamydiota bacterium]MBI3278129.1 TolC family protein [Chlamydiota bacterium]
MKKSSLIIAIVLLAFAGTFLNAYADERTDFSLQQALDQALESNLSLKVERISPPISKLDIQKNKGVFDPNFSLKSNYDDGRTPLTKQYSIAAGGLLQTQSKTMTSLGELRGKIPLGTQYLLNFKSIRDSSTFNRFDAEYSQVASFTLIQPLLKDFGTGTNTAWIRISKNNFTSSKLKLKQTIIDLVSQVESTYWDLVLAREDLEVKKESLKLAQSLFEQTETKAKIGTVSPLEVVQARAGVATREESLLLAEQAIKLQENNLKKLLFKDMLLHRMTQPIPTEQAQPEYHEASIDERIKWALENRPDLKQMKLELENQNILLKYYQNQSLPRLDLQGTLGLNGLGGGFANALDNTFSEDNPLWGVGINVTYPLGNRTEKANVQQSKLQIKKSLLELKKLEDNIIIDTDTLTSQVATLWKKIQASALSKQYAEEALKAEQKKYEAGISTSHNVLDFEEDLAIAKSNELHSQVDYMKASIELDRTQGTTLETNHIHIFEEE